MAEPMNAPLHPVVADVAARVEARSAGPRAAYLAAIASARRPERGRARLSCGNLAHAIAAAPAGDKSQLQGLLAPNIAIVTSYNDMLSAHQPLETYPALLKAAAREAGATAQVAGGTPAMCDGVTQGRPGMELSLFSRDVIAMSTAVALSHDVFDAGLMLGVCDKIVPGLFMGAASFGQLPILFVPAGPMPSGLPNKEKAEVRKRYAEGKASRDELLAAEMASYHGPGTCTFYGTANSNQMLMELMGLHLPGAAFINPNTPLREALTRAAAARAAHLARKGEGAFAEVVDARAIVNAVVGLLATGGSTNHTLHLVAMAARLGLRLTWDDFSALSAVTPLIARVYPNGQADVNHFHAAGGMAFVTRTLAEAGLLHTDVLTVAGPGLLRYCEEPWLDDGALAWRAGAATSLAPDILRPASDPFDAEGGIKLMQGNLGRAVIKVSAVRADQRVIEAPAAVFEDQAEFLAAFKKGLLDRDVVAVIRFQGPRANGMPELHQLTPALSVLQGRGFKVGLVTDGRMSGASGAAAAALHLTPEALDGGPLARLRDGDLVRLDGERGALDVLMDMADLMARPPATPNLAGNASGYGRDLFAPMRAMAGPAEEGAALFAPLPAEKVPAYA